MPIYTTVQNSAAPIPSFVDRGIGNKMPGPIGDVSVFVVREGGVDMSFKIVTENLQQVVFSQLTKTTSFVYAECNNLFRLVNPRMLFDIPTTSIILPNLSNESEGAIRGLGFTQETGRKQVWLGNVRPQDLNTVMKMGPSDGRVAPGTVGMDASIAYLYALKGMEIWSWISDVANNGQYSFIGSDIVTEDIQDEGLSVFIGGNRVVFNKDEAIEFFKERKAEKGVSCSGKIQLITSSISIDSQVQGSPIGLAGEGVHGEGTFFAYFHGMNHPDKDYAAHVFGSTFIRCLADKMENCAGLWHKIRRGLRQLSMTRSGQAITHAYLGIELSKNAGMPVYFVVNTTGYHGFVLGGAAKTYIFSDIVKSISAAELKEDIQSLNKQDSLLTEIAGILNAVVNSSGMPIYAHSKFSLNTSFKLASAILAIPEREFTDNIIKSSLKPLLEDLVYNDVYALPNLKNFNKVLQAIRSDDFSLLQEFPVRITGTMLELRNILYYSLSVFGDKAPSCSYGDPKQCQKFIIPRLNVTQDPLTTVPAGGSRILKYIPFKLEPVGAAHNQMQKLFADATFLIPDGRKGRSEFTDKRQETFHTPDNAFDDTYDLVRGICETRRSGGTKRKRDNEEGSSSKSKKAKQAIDIMLQDEF